MAFFDDEEEKRKLLLTPGINPKVPLPLPPLTPAPSLANLRTAPPVLPRLGSGVMPLPSPAAPTPDASSLGMLPSPSAPALSKSSQLYNAKADYLEKTPGRFKSGLRGVLQGAIAGLAGGGGLGGALGGALGGGLVGGISPKTLREAEFNQRIKPQILERLALEDQDRAAQAAANDQAWKQRGMMADIDLKTSQAEKNRRPTLPQDQYESSPFGIFNKRTGQVTTAAPPKQPTYSSSPAGIFRRDTGEVTTPAPRKTSTPPASALKAITELDQLKRDAESAWADWGNFKPTSDQSEDTPELKEGRRQAASEAQAAYNEAVKRFGEIYGDDFETGGFTDAKGNAGWAYVKRRNGQSAAQPTGQRKATVGPDFVNHVASKLGVSPEKAKQMIEADGYTVK